MSTELTPKQYPHRGMGRYLIGQYVGDRLDIYRGARTLEGARVAKREISHWPHRVIVDQATGEVIS